MYNNYHWASDVTIGAAIGTFAGLKVVRYHHRVNPDNRLDRWLLNVNITPTALDAGATGLDGARAVDVRTEGDRVAAVGQEGHDVHAREIPAQFVGDVVVEAQVGGIRVERSKTEAGERAVDLQPELRDELLAWKAHAPHAGRDGDHRHRARRPRADGARRGRHHDGLAFDRTCERVDRDIRAETGEAECPERVRKLLRTEIEIAQTFAPAHRVVLPVPEAADVIAGLETRMA